MELLLKSLMMAVGVHFFKAVRSVIGEPLFWVIFIGLAIIGIIAGLVEHKKSK